MILSGKRHADDDAVTEKMKNDNLFRNMGLIIENMEPEAVLPGFAGCGMNAAITAAREKPEVKNSLGIPEGYDLTASMLIGYTGWRAKRKGERIDMVLDALMKEKERQEDLQISIIPILTDTATSCFCE